MEEQCQGEYRLAELDAAVHHLMISDLNIKDADGVFLPFKVLKGVWVTSLIKSWEKELVSARILLWVFNLLIFICRRRVLLGDSHSDRFYEPISASLPLPEEETSDSNVTAERIKAVNELLNLVGMEFEQCPNKAKRDSKEDDVEDATHNNFLELETEAHTGETLLPGLVRVKFALPFAVYSALSQKMLSNHLVPLEALSS
eukprot:TRINITY_DN11677_c0_g1_i1.p1 TRINITY_DN11677_c0_g1~~TRINITY_DN11677_c0_g1_i1.p1  ORF type:complete len:233 (+),score=39.75 TRINITY_DN11677_c0_g1_i1:99-701(+)